MKLINPTTIEGWLQPHSIQWYKQLSELQGKYIYPWRCTLTEPDALNQRLDVSDFSYSEIDVINSIEYIHSPLDILKLRCFGQHPAIYELLKEKNVDELTTIFEQNATADGLSITFSRYIVRATV